MQVPGSLTGTRVPVASMLLYEQLNYEPILRCLECLEYCIRADIRSDDRLTEYYGSFNWSRSTFTVHLRRKYLYYVIHLILPYFLFCLIAMSSLLLQPSRPERITLGTVSQVEPVVAHGV